MADAQDKQVQKEAKERATQAREAGEIPSHRNFVLQSGPGFRTAWAWAPRLRWIVVASATVSMVALLASLIAVYQRSSPMVFLSLPDGSIACGPSSDAKGRRIAHNAEHQRLCDRLVPPAGLESIPEPTGGR